MEKQNTSVIQKLSISYECALAIGNSLNLSEMLHDVIHTTVHKTNAQRGSIWLREKEGENIKLGARAGSLLTKADIKKRVSSLQDIFEKIWENQRPVIKNRDDKDFFQYCFKITGKEQSILIVPVKNVAIIKLVYTNKEIVNETLANMLLSLSEKLSIAIDACLAHDNIKKEIQIRKETEDLLKHSEQQYHSTIDSIGKAIHVVDENLSILLFNETFKQWNKELGLETKNLIGRNIFDIFPFLPDAVREEYQKVFKTGKMLITVETNELAGKVITTETRKIPILENNKVVRVVTVIDDITERKQAEQVQSVLYNIAEAVNTTKDLDELYQLIHKQLGTIVDTTNFYVALYDEKSNIITAPYYVDQLKKNIPQPQQLKNGLTAYVIHTAKHLYLTIEKREKLMKEGKIAQADWKSKIWIGVPLKTKNKVIGALAVQSYTNASLYTEKDLEILEFVSKEIAIAIERKQVEKALRESEERFRSIVEHSHDGIVIVDDAYRLLYVNDELCRTFRYSREEIIGQNFRKFLDEESKQLLVDRYIRRQRGEMVPPRYESNIMRNDGEKRRVEISSTVTKDSAGKVKTMAQILDITERKRAEDTLRESEEKFKTLFKKNPAPQVYIDENLRILDINSNFKELFGYELDEIKGKNIDDVVVPKGMMEEAEDLNERAEEGYFYHETVRKSKDGKKIPVSISGISITLKGRKQYITTYEDITEANQVEDELKKKTEQIISDKEKIEELYKDSEENRKSLLSILEDTAEKEKALRESQERFQNIVANTGDWIWETDAQGRYTYSSPIVKQVLGYEYQEMLGKHFYDLALPDEQDKFKKTALESSKEKEKVKNLVSQNVHKDGHIVSLETNAVPLLDDKGNLLGYRGVTRDITDRKRAEQIQSVLYNIADAVNTSKDLDELFKIIHKQLSTIIDTTNYYVALYDKETDTIALPYDVDEKDRFTTFPAGKTLTAYVIKIGKSLLATEEVSEKLIQAGEVEVIGTPSKIWLGIPLKIENEVIGVVVVQSYTDASLYTKKDLAILEFVSDEIALAIKRKRMEESLKKSEEKYRKQFEDSLDAIVIADAETGILIDCNRASLELVGREKSEFVGKHQRILHPPEEIKGEFSRTFKQHLKEKEGQVLETQVITKKGEIKEVAIKASIIELKNKKVLQGIFRDITERKQAEKLQSAIYKISDAINTTANLDELYQTIHQHLSTVIDTANFYIALYDEDKELMSFPYFVDEKDSQPTPRKPRKGLTEYVMRTGKAIFVTEDSLNKLEEKGEVELLGSSSALWLGIPLKIEKKIIGVIAVQSYTDASLYNEKDLEILEFASDQIAIAIERKRAEEARRESEKHFRDTIENIFKFVPDSLLVFTDKLNLFRENKAFQDIIQKYAAKLNYTESELKKIITEQIKNKILKKDHTEIRISKKI